jgi:hypothetical protein
MAVVVSCRDNFLWRMKEDLCDLEGNPRCSRHATPRPARCPSRHPSLTPTRPSWTTSTSGTRLCACPVHLLEEAASSIAAAAETLRRRPAALAGSQAAANQRIADALSIGDAEQDPGDEGDGDTEQAS